MRPLLRFVLGLFSLVGLNPLQRNAFGKVRYILTFIFGYCMVIANVLLVVLNWQGVKTFAENYMFPSILMFVAKSTTILVNTDILQDIINNILNFWPADKFGEEFGKKINKLHRMSFLAAVPFNMNALIVIFMFSFSPLLMTDRVLTFSGYYFCDLKTTPCYELVHSWQAIVLFLQIYPAVIGFDTLFMYFIAEGYGAIELLKQALRSIKVSMKDDHQNSEAIAEFSHQHAIVLEYISNMREFYGGLMLVQAGSTLVAMICCLYVITADGFPPPLSVLPIYAGTFTIQALQFFAYCFGGTLVMEQTLTLADEAYNVAWYKKTQPILRKNLSFIILRSQKAEKLTVGKMVELNLECFLSVLKNAVSVYGLVLTLEENRDG